MRIGLITEGRPDQAVIENILEGHFKEIDFNVIQIRPELLQDETDIHLKSAAALGGLSRIKADCEEKSKFETFFAISGDDDFIIIQADTAEIEQFGVERPNKKQDDYSTGLRENTITKIQEWLGEDFDEPLAFAISIEELEAWILTLFEKRDTSTSMNPKEKLKKILNRKNQHSEESFENYYALTKKMKKPKVLIDCRKHNQSLNLFLGDLTEKHTPTAE